MAITWMLEPFIVHATTYQFSVSYTAEKSFKQARKRY